MGALDGIKVIDCSILVQGPQAAAFLHDLGAEVVKVELPGLGDLARWITIAPDDPRAPYYEACNRGKKGVSLDLRTAGGRRAMLKLCESADVLITNFAPGTLEKWNLGYDVIAAVNPRLIFATGSILGTEGPGPAAGREGADLFGQAFGGLIHATGVDGGEITTIPVTIADHCASQNMTVGILAALWARERTGRGQRVDVSLTGGQVWAQASELTHHLLSGRSHPRANYGHPLIPGLYGIFASADGWVAVVGVPPHLWQGFCRALDREDLLADARFGTLFLTPDDLAALKVIVAEVFRTRTTAEWTERMNAEGQRFAPVNDYAGLAADPHPYLNGYLVEAEHPEWGPTRIVGSPIRLSDTPATPGLVAPKLGEHTEEVLLAAGFTPEELEQLKADGAYF
ncbi:MAG: CaiB/BaiF CoA transferase family protein [Acidimicrobiales bacterium]